MRQLKPRAVVRIDVETEKSAEYKLKIVRNAQKRNKMHQVLWHTPTPSRSPYVTDVT